MRNLLASRAIRDDMMPHDLTRETNEFQKMILCTHSLAADKRCLLIYVLRKKGCPFEAAF